MLWLAVLEYAVLASTFTIAKVAVGHAEPLFLIGVRMVAASPLMLLVHRFHSASFHIKREDYWLFVKVSFFHILFPFVGEFWALQYISSAKTAITYALTPFVAALLSFFLLKKKLSKRQTVGLVIGLLGLMPIFLSGDDVAFAGGEFFSISIPELVLLCVVTSASYAWFVVAELMRRGYGISLINGVAMFFGGAVSLILWYFLGGEGSPVRGDLSSFLWWTGLLILVSNVISLQSLRLLIESHFDYLHECHRLFMPHFCINLWGVFAE